MRVPRIYLPELPAAGATTELTGQAQHYLINVLRLEAGRPLRVFDGQGREGEALVQADRRLGLDRPDPLVHRGAGVGQDACEQAQRPGVVRRGRAEQQGGGAAHDRLLQRVLARRERPDAAQGRVEFAQGEVRVGEHGQVLGAQGQALALGPVVLAHDGLVVALVADAQLPLAPVDRPGLGQVGFAGADADIQSIGNFLVGTIFKHVQVKNVSVGGRKTFHAFPYVGHFQRISRVRLFFLLFGYVRAVFLDGTFLIDSLHVDFLLSGMIDGGIYHDPPNPTFQRPVKIKPIQV